MRRWQIGAGITLGLAVLLWGVLTGFRLVDESELAPEGDDTAHGDVEPALRGAASGELPELPSTRTQPGPEESKPAAQPSFAYIVGLAHDEDDPALPAERRRVDVEVVDLEGNVVPRLLLRGSWGEWHTRAYETDEDGRVVMHLPRNTRAIEAVGQNGEATGTYGYVHVHPLAEHETHTRVVLRSYREVSGRVSISGQRVIVGQVRAYRRNRSRSRDGKRLVDFYNMAHVTAKTQVKHDGSFTLQVPDDANVVLLFTAGVTMKDPVAVMEDVAPGTTGIHMVAHPRTRMSTAEVRVVDQGGHPVVGATLTFHPIGLTENRLAGTDVDGRASVAAIEGWMYRVDVAPPIGANSYWGPMRRLVRSDGIEREIVLPPKPGRIHGTVVDADGRPVRAWLGIFDGPNIVAAMGTNEKGEFSGPSNAAVGTRLHIYARHPMNEPTSLGYAEGVYAGDPIHIELKQIGPLSVAAKKKAEKNKAASTKHPGDK